MTSYGTRGKWRKARKDHKCDYWFGKSSGGLCGNPIPKGSYYWDTFELNGGGFMATDRLCHDCASKFVGCIDAKNPPKMEEKLHKEYQRRAR